jgi:hypothetical protein
MGFSCFLFLPDDDNTSLGAPAVQDMLGPV